MSDHTQKFVITGASGGIGAAIAERLAREGYALLLAGRSQQKLDTIRQSLDGDQHQTLACDLTDAAGVGALASAAQAFGANGLINCLGINLLAELAQTSPQAIAQIIATNLVAPMNCCAALTPILRTHGQATIVNLGSILGSIGFAGSTAYCASKFGLHGFTEALRRETAEAGITVIYLAPRATATTLNTDAMMQLNQALGNAVDPPEWVAGQTLMAIKAGRSRDYFLGQPESFFVRLNALFPGLVDKALAKNLRLIKKFCHQNNPATAN